MFLALLPVQHANAENLYSKIVNYFNKNGIPYKENLIGFASDGASVMVGQYNSVQTRLKSDIPNIFILKCICHSFSLCASSACGKLPRAIEDLIRNVHNYISNSPKRVDTLKEFQKFTHTPIHKLLHPAQTRWLSLESAVNRIIEQYNALVLFFRSEGAENILNQLQDPLTKPFLIFLQFALPLFTNLNKEMQSEKPKLYQLHTSVSTVYKTLLEYYIKRQVIQEQALYEVNYKDPANFLPLEEIYLGAKIAIIMSSLSKESAYVLRKRCLDFFIESAYQINKRFNFRDEILVNMNLINPSIILDAKFSSIVPLAKYFPNLIQEDKLQELDNEWRLLRNTDTMRDYITSHSDLNIQEFWGKVSKIRRGDDSVMFPTLSNFVFNILCLPHSSANVERIFSQVNLMKTDHRNRLSTASIVGHLHTKHYLKSRGEKCFTTNFPKELVNYHNSNIYKKNQDEVTDSEADSESN